MEKYMFASDIHGAADNCRKILDVFERSGAGRLILLGDLLYHGPRNALPGEYSTAKVYEMLNAFAGSIVAVRGNCDAEIDQMVLQFPMMADYALLELNGIDFFATHGHLFNAMSESSLPPVKNGGALIHGHTHIPVAERTVMAGKSFYVLNPGSAGIPKGGFPASYGMLEDREFVVFDLEGKVLMSVDMSRDYTG